MQMKPKRNRVLFLCNHNSSRSQMAEGLLRYYGGKWFEVFSAGTSPSRVHPMAVEVMKEKGIDLTGQRSKSIDEFLGQGFDFIVTTCDDARDRCPVFPGQGESLHWVLEDPAGTAGSREKKLEVFRRVRDELERLIHSHFPADSGEPLVLREEDNPEFST
ncbi:MAG: arsenate reductase ArsC [Proteobacteria bacterium]|nr:arsenate reductase ArsC [Pseudomonadota bacterium]NIS61260.1 arsenate reductase ArsC [Pseudomonadota bacterium]